MHRTLAFRHILFRERSLSMAEADIPAIQVPVCGVSRNKGWVSRVQSKLSSELGGVHAYNPSTQRTPEFKISLGNNEFEANLSYKIRKTYLREPKQKTRKTAKVRYKIQGS